MDNRPIADQLSDLRARIKALQEREAVLRDQVCVGGDMSGDRFAAQVHRSPPRRLLHDRLPATVESDPQYRETEERSYAKMRSCHQFEPVQRSFLPEDEDDFAVIEPF